MCRNDRATYYHRPTLGETSLLFGRITEFEKVFVVRDVLGMD